MKSGNFIGLFSLFLMLGLERAWPQEPAIEAEALEIATTALDYLGTQEKFSFRWFVEYEEIVAGREKITYFRSGRALMDRSNGFVIETEQAGGLRDYYFNGEQFTVVSPDENFYASSSFAEGFDALVEAARERTGLVLPLWSIMSPSIKERWLEGIERGAYLGTTVIAGEPVHHLAFSEYDEDWQVWISTDPDHPVIVMLIGTDLYQQGWPQYRAYSNDWDFAPEIEPGIFTFKPDPDDMPVAMPDLLAAASEGDATTASDSGPGDGNAE